eukprot:m.93792 g.93792  ORF g.93792 m.93792 type:complete len:83 (-) comp13411_c0_seq1:25-273(-)
MIEYCVLFKVRRYCEKMGLPYPLKSWNFCIAFAFFRLAVIIQGVACRLSRNQASQNMFTVEGATALADMLIEFAFMSLDGKA